MTDDDIKRTHDIEQGIASTRVLAACVVTFYDECRKLQDEDTAHALTLMYLRDMTGKNDPKPDAP